MKRRSGVPTDYTPTPDEVCIAYMMYRAPFIQRVDWFPDRAAVDEVSSAEFARFLGTQNPTSNQAEVDVPFVGVGFEAGTTFALTGENAGHWVEGHPTHVSIEDLQQLRAPCVEAKPDFAPSHAVAAHPSQAGVAPSTHLSIALQEARAGGEEQRMSLIDRLRAEAKAWRESVGEMPIFDEMADFLEAPREDANSDASAL